MIEQIKILLELTKFRISLFSTLSASLGFILAKGELTPGIFLPILGVLLLACGSCALNQYQERKADRLMERTRDRPLPSGRLAPRVCLSVSLGLMLSGAAILFRRADLTAWGLGLFAVVWYNGVYTYLKRKTAFAALPGAMVGGIPPLIGWVSGGGSFLGPEILAISFFFFMWQIPHFWLLLIHCGKDYEQAGFASLTRVFTPMQLERITFVWVFATAVTCIIIPLFGVVESQVINGSLVGAGAWLVWEASRTVTGKKREFRFKVTNTYVLFVMVLLAFDKLFY
ncbi:MAG: protoheme IX farnesyltransferase [Thermodesulfobacteriota bacterium]